tara:strand:- start:3088 stop:3297 length:210 start_codon:yes stop_codon:yes gene_type:complete
MHERERVPPFRVNSANDWFANFELGRILNWMVDHFTRHYLEKGCCPAIFMEDLPGIAGLAPATGIAMGL